jgi:hypothetical protein
MEKEKQKFNLISISWNLDKLVLNKDLGILLISHSNGIQEQKCWKKVEIMCEEIVPCQLATQGQQLTKKRTFPRSHLLQIRQP